MDERADTAYIRPDGRTYSYSDLSLTRHRVECMQSRRAAGKRYVKIE